MFNRKKTDVCIAHCRRSKMHIWALEVQNDPKKCLDVYGDHTEQTQFDILGAYCTVTSPGLEGVADVDQKEDKNDPAQSRMRMV